LYGRTWEKARPVLLLFRQRQNTTVKLMKASHAHVCGIFQAGPHTFPNLHGACAIAWPSARFASRCALATPKAEFPSFSENLVKEVAHARARVR